MALPHVARSARRSAGLKDAWPADERAVARAAQMVDWGHSKELLPAAGWASLPACRSAG